MCGSKYEIGGSSPVDRQTIDPPSRPPDSRSALPGPSPVDLKNQLFRVLRRQCVISPWFAPSSRPCWPPTRRTPLPPSTTADLRQQLHHTSHWPPEAHSRRVGPQIFLFGHHLSRYKIKRHFFDVDHTVLSRGHVPPKSTGRSLAVRPQGRNAKWKVVRFGVQPPLYLCPGCTRSKPHYFPR